MQQVEEEAGTGEAVLVMLKSMDKIGSKRLKANLESKEKQFQDKREMITLLLLHWAILAVNKCNQ